MDGPWKLHKGAKGNVELYNLEDVPFEEYEISADHEDIVQDLLDKVDHWNAGLPEINTRNKPQGKIR